MSAKGTEAVDEINLSSEISSGSLKKKKRKIKKKDQNTSTKQSTSTILDQCAKDRC